MIFAQDEDSVEKKNCMNILKTCVSSTIDNRSCNKPKERLWFRGVRSSKFRHVYGAPAKREGCYENIKITKNAHDSHFCAVNPKFVAVVTEVAGGGTFLVLPLSSTGRLDFNSSRVTGHRGPVLDIKWNPFNDNIIASCSDDCTIKLWHIPDGGLVTHLNEWLMDLHGHKRRVGYIEWHPTAENILVSAGFDHLMIVWDVGSGEAVTVIDCHPDVIYSMSFNRDGSLIATTCKDKKLRVIEPRRGIVLTEGICHAGTKACKVVFLGNTGRLLTTGFSRYSDRQYAVWSQSDLSGPLCVETIDSSSGVLFPYYDHDCRMVYLAGKGDGNIRYYEVVDEAPWLYYLNQFLSGSPQRGLGFMPKRGCDITQCEIFRFYKLHASKGVCEPVAMIVPRKSDQFQDDLYPDTAAPIPALTAQEWVTGKNCNPIMMSMKTGFKAQRNARPLPLIHKDEDMIVDQENVGPYTKMVPFNFRPPNGVMVKTHKPKVYQSAEMTLSTSHNNNSRKFAFLSTETVPDYRPKDAVSEKNQKTSNNQSTKFYQLQKMFNSNNAGQASIIMNDDNKKMNEYNDENDELLEIPKTEYQLQRAYMRQCEEIKLLRKQLANRDRRIRELEEQVNKQQQRKFYK